MLCLSRCHSCYQTGWLGVRDEAKLKDVIYSKPIYCEVFSQKLSCSQAQAQAAGLPPGKCCSKGYFSKIVCEGGVAVFLFMAQKVVSGVIEHTGTLTVLISHQNKN